jgi:hypothetical protein
MYIQIEVDCAGIIGYDKQRQEVNVFDIAVPQDNNLPTMYASTTKVYKTG